MKRMNDNPRMRASDIQRRSRADPWIRSSIPLLSFLTLGLPAGVNGHISLTRGIRYMGWLHASWALGAALGPPVVVLSLAGTSSWRAGFAAMGAAFLANGLLVSARRQDWAKATLSPTGHPSEKAPGRIIYRRAIVMLAGLFLVAAGLEATAGDWSYTQLTVGRGVPAGLATWGATLFWAGLAAGRVALGVLGNRLPAIRLLDAGIGICVLARFAAICSARARSSRVVILMLSGSPSITATSPPAHSMTEAVSVPTKPWRAALLWASSSQVAWKACGVCTAQRFLG